MNKHDFNDALECIKEEIKYNVKTCNMLLDKCVTEDICLVADLIIQHDGEIKIESDSLRRYNQLLPVKVQDKILKLYKKLSIKIEEKVINNLKIDFTADRKPMVYDLPHYSHSANIEFLSQSISEFDNILNDWDIMKNTAYTRYLKNIESSEQQAQFNISNTNGVTNLIVGKHNKIDANQQIYNNHKIPLELLTKIEKLFTKYEINQQNQDDILKDIKIIVTQSDQTQKFPNIFSCLSKIGGFAQNIHNIQQLINDWTPIFQSIF